MNKRVLIGLGVAVLVILAGVGGYFLGVSAEQTRAAQARQQFGRGRFGPQGQGAQAGSPDQTPQAGQQGGARLGGGVRGTISSVEGDTLVLDTSNGNVQIKTTDTTLVEKFTSVTLKDLATGEQVMVMGSRNADGSFTARSIQSLPASQTPQPNQQ